MHKIRVDLHKKYKMEIMEMSGNAALWQSVSKSDNSWNKRVQTFMQKINDYNKLQKCFLG